MRAKKKKKLTACKMFGVKFDIDTDVLWENLISEPFESQLATIADIHHFAYHIDHLKLSKKEADRFIEAYRKPQAMKARQVAIQGLASANHSDALDILRSASACVKRGARIAEKINPMEEPLDLTQELQEVSLLGLGARLVEIVGMGDFKKLEQMARLLRDGKIPATDKPRGGEDAQIGQMFRDFCQLHINLKGLPTKKQLRVACGIGPDHEGMEQARRMMNKLGLSELPHAKGPPEN
jgi:hypothetical protein